MLRTITLPFLVLLICLGTGNLLSAQTALQVSGTVLEGSTQNPVPYASVAAFSSETKALLTGATTAENGRFTLNVRTDGFYVQISFVGFRDTIIRPTAAAGASVDLGTIRLYPNTQTLEEVDVTAERSVVQFALDKRVFNIGQDLASTGMGALDLLNNVPSVTVDIEGQISLRGNSGVQILINGKPSVLSDEGATALGTLTADMIESIEVITNPSAKYQAEGSSGIINIVLKKDEKKGFNGSVSANTGLPDNHSLGVSLNRRTENFNFFTQFGAGYRSLPDYNESINLSLADTGLVLSEGTEFRNERFANITLGTDYHINDHNVLTLSGSFAYEDEEQPSETDIRSIGADGQVISAYTREETTTAGNPKYQYDLQYERQFKSNEEHVLQFSTQGSFFGKEQESSFVNVLSEGVRIDPNMQTETDYYQQDFIFKLDYRNPFTDEWTLEAGAQYDLNDVGNEFAVFNEDSTGNYVLDSALANNFEWNQKVLGVYATGSYEGEAWGIKLGLRVENTDLSTLLTTTNEANNRNYTNFFPSLHTSYKFSETFSMQAGYSRRIYRPRLWDLNPFFNIRNNYNIRRGNPDLQPEFADSYELTGILILNKASINASVYHLYTTDVIERVSFFEGNVNITEPINVGTRRQTGLELNGKYNPTDWLSFNGDFNYGFFQRDGSFETQDFDFTGQQWFTRLTTRVKLPADFELEVSGDYRSPYRSVQGTRTGFAFMDAGLRKKFWKGKLVANFSVRDVFASRVREQIVSQPSFYLYDWSKRGRFLAFGLSYSFGKGEAMAYTGRRR